MKKILLLFLIAFGLLNIHAQDSVNITFHLNMANETVDTGGVYIAGGAAFGNPGDFELTDPDGDDVYSITVRRPKGFASHYIFTNGSCVNFSCKESLIGQPCADPNNFNDRYLPAVQTDTVLSTCFGVCSSTTNCVLPTVDVTFQVDMSLEQVAPTGVFMGANWDGWTGGLQMTDPDGDGVYTYTAALTPGQYLFKYINGSNWSGPEPIDSTSGSCTVTGGGNTNRRIVVGGSNMTVPLTCFGSCSECPPQYDVTFNVDMSQQTVAPTGVFIGAGFESWEGKVQMTDPDGDDIYSATVPLLSGNYQFKFINGANWAQQENLNPADVACTVTFGTNTNRIVVVDTSDIVLPEFCWEKCTECINVGPDSVAVSFNVNMNNETVDPSGVYIAGGSFGVPGDHELTDLDGDGIYSISLIRHKDSASNYVFLNGLCPDFSCAENLAGLSCADPANANYRSLPALSGDVTISTCFGQCTTDGSCNSNTDPVNVTFRVDMKQKEIATSGVFMGASFDNWTGGLQMQDTDNDSIYELTVQLAPGTYEWRFINGANWADPEEFDPESSDSTCTIPAGNVANRIVTVPVADLTLPTYCFNSCDGCWATGINDLLLDNKFFKLAPSRALTHTIVSFDQGMSEVKNISILNIAGKVVHQHVLNRNELEHSIKTNHLPSGLYFVNVQTSTRMGTRKLMVVK